MNLNDVHETIYINFYDFYNIYILIILYILLSIVSRRYSRKPMLHLDQSLLAYS